MSFSYFDKITDTPIDFFIFLLILGVVFVNGFTDAPSSISGIISSKILSKRKACFLGGICNFAGVLLSSTLGFKVAKSVSSLASFGEYGKEGVCACLLTVIVFGIVAWMFAMPSSESHALISAIFGASLCLGKSSYTCFFKIILCTVIISLIIVPICVIFCKILQKSDREYLKLEILSSIGASTMHGLQDGQKLLALLVLISLGKSQTDTPIIFVVIVGVVMMLGTLAGGGRLIDTLGNDIVKNTEKIAFVSDFCATVCIFLCSLLGLPISTGNIKACSLIGAGLGEKQSVNVAGVIKITLTFIITFPVCILLGYFFTMIFIRLL